MKNNFASFLTIFLISLFIFFGEIPVYARKPPWSGGPGGPGDVPSAPEPVSIILIGMGASGLAGYLIGKRKKK